MTYGQKLADPRWQIKREQIICRDNYRCVDCGGKTNLQVHHLGYIQNVQPWEYPHEFLITLCNECHSLEEKFKIKLQELIKELAISGHSFITLFGVLEEFKNNLPPKADILTTRLNPNYHG